MAYKFQLGKFIASGSIDIEERLDVQGDTLLSGSIKLGNAQADEIRIKAGDLKFEETHVFEMKNSEMEAIEFKDQSDNSYLQMSTAGTGSVIVGKRLDAGAGLAISGSLVKASAAELNYVEGVTAGSAASGRAVVLNASRDVSGLNDLSASAIAVTEGYFGTNNYTIGNAAVPDFITMKASVVEFKDGALDVDIASHDGTNGLKLGGALLSATAADLNNLDGFADAAYAPAADSVVFFDATDSKLKRDSAADFAGAISAGALTASAGVLGVAVDDSSLEMQSNALRVKAAGVTNDMLAGSIVASKMNNAIFADLETLGAPTADGEFIVATGAGAFAYETGATARTSMGLGTGDSVQFTDLTLSGDLVVQGTTVTLDVATVGITGSFVFEGATADANELTLGVIDPTADRAVNIADSAGTLVPFAAAPAAGVQISATPIELNLLDGGTAVGSSITLADSDGFIVNDGGVMKSIPASDISAYVGNGLKETVQTISANATLNTANGAQVLLNASGGAFTLTLPANSGEEGRVIKLKKISTGGNAVTIHRAGTDTIDGGHSIVLESDYAAVSLISDGGGKWFII